ncbi:hypothetical protein KITKAT_71 [Arthrobacter phage Kitkat]|uniref:Uncharacterized protein n=3 Tax=Kelleziovirus TaxID=1982236 RepID=A0A140G6F4_9CAUD|nr:hypothetical protein BJD78_gp69 [Arthrobacter phage KellEzio]YP_009303354.1 hypothetical protein BJD77_gp071 [Arthrobacter phage Kitkat]AMM44239.1 hypothetical protein KELLEZIO_69 [Arthrobacter phage KellEzio]AMM44332.1 hypothetical protein KITKAT_71 [Arthrobacter phage Kitkat]QGJ96509.1 hypothetical protein SEA_BEATUSCOMEDENTI_70 [Arthrobacter phage BeatusComedenti]
MTTMTKPTTLRRHLWSLRSVAELCEKHDVPTPKVAIEYDGRDMEVQWFVGYSSQPTGPDMFRKIMATLPDDLIWQQNAYSGDTLDGSYNSNYFRVTSLWEVDGGLPVKLEIWSTRPGFPTEQFAHLPIKAED